MGVTKSFKESVEDIIYETSRYSHQRTLEPSGESDFKDKAFRETERASIVNIVTLHNQKLDELKEEMKMHSWKVVRPGGTELIDIIAIGKVLSLIERAKE